MLLMSLEIPESKLDQVRWVEELIVGSKLRECVSELSAVHRREDTSLDAIIGDELGNVLQSGLNVLSKKQLNQLLCSPTTLFKLQDHVLLSGGEYWEKLFQDVTPVTARSAGDVLGEIRTASDDFAPSPYEAPIRLSTKHHYPHLLNAAIALATAASVLIAISVFSPSNTQPSARLNLGRLVTRQSPPASLHEFATAIDNWWSDKASAQSTGELADSLHELRQGCTRLLLTKHEGLTKEDRSWLDEKCRKWSAKIDEYIAALEDNAPFDTVHNEAEATIAKLIEALYDRAQGNA